jgi:hypothetical protein
MGGTVLLAGLVGVLLLTDKDRPQLHKQIRPGDVICVERWGNLYRHYGVYVGKGKVIHYAGRGGDWEDDVSVREVSMQEFLRDADEYMICKFPSKCKDPRYHRYTKKETVERAYSRLGERKYDLLTNNCEHFAVWCRTNISESRQVDRTGNLLSGFMAFVDELLD